MTESGELGRGLEELVILGAQHVQILINRRQARWCSLSVERCTVVQYCHTQPWVPRFVGSTQVSTQSRLPSARLRHQH